MSDRYFKILTQDEFDFLDQKDSGGVYDRETRETLYWTLEKLEENLKKATRREKELFQRFKQANFGILLEEGTVSKGNLLHPGSVTLHGRMEGDILIQDTLTIGPQGIVVGSASAGTVVSQGEIHGNVQAMQRVWLGAGARVIGNIHTPAIEMAEGAYLEGRLVMPEHGKDFTLKQEREKPPKKFRLGINTWKVKVFNIK
jgi:cytoskeletal protein CcmA (bactofilin family)